MNTFKIELELPKVVPITSRDQTVDAELEKMNAYIIARLVVHGLYQKTADSGAAAANSAAIGELGNMEGWSVERKKQAVKEWTGDKGNWAVIGAEGKRMMEATLARLLEGDWGKERTGGGGVDPVVVAARRLAAEIIKRGLVDRDGNAKAYTALSQADKNAACDKMLAGKPELVEQAEAELETKRQAVKEVSLEDLGL